MENNKKCKKCKRKFTYTLTEEQKDSRSIQIECPNCHEINLITPGMAHIAFSFNEKEQLTKYSEEGNTTISEFIRQAIYDKIRVIENPDKYQDISSSQAQLAEINKKLDLQNKRQERIEKRLNIVNGINETMEALKPLINREELKKLCETIISMLRVYKKVSIDKLITLTGYEKRVIYDCIAMSDKLNINENEEVIF